MIPLADLHCHLLAGLDDGPRTEAEALQMCRQACAEGVRLVAALAHQNERWPDATADRIRQAAVRLARQLADQGSPLAVFPCAEVMAHTGLLASWHEGQLLSVADRRQYVLVEMPHGLCVDLRQTAADLRAAGVRLILAHPERHPELLHEAGRIDDLIRAGCLVQVSAASVTHPPSRREALALKRWFRRGVVHLLGSDGHSPSRRPPRLAEAYHRVAAWAGSKVADRVGSTNGMAILNGLPLRIPEPQPERRRWFAGLW